MWISEHAFRITKAAQTFQRFNDQIIRGLPGLFVYIDDLPAASSIIAEHLQQLRQLFMQLRKHGISINVEKYEFRKGYLQFLGHIVTSQCITPLPAEVDAIRDYLLPDQRKKLR